jgi:uridine phosphorylase
MSIIDAFDGTTEEVLKPHYISPKIEGFPALVVSSFQHEIIGQITDIAETEVLCTQYCGYPIPVYKAGYGGKEVAVYQSPMGGSMAASCMDELIARGGKTFIFFGCCGILDDSIKSNQIIVPVSACRDEGASYHYAPPADYIGIPTADKLSNILDELNIPFVRTKVWTNDAIYRETLKNVQKRRSEGCGAVDNECASVMAVGAFRHVDVYQFLFTEDSVAGDDWEPGTIRKVPKSTYEMYLRLALDIASKV